METSRKVVTFPKVEQNVKVKREEKMISCFLLITLTSCVCATFVVTVTQSSYQAEENHNITLEWSFTPKPLTSHSSLIIYCQLITDHRVSVLYHVHEGVEVPESQDEQFSGRVQSDRDALREGRVRLHVSRLRTEDSGLYQCQVLTPDGRGSETCLLNVSAVEESKYQRQIQRPTEGPEPESRGRIGLYTGLGLTAAAAAALLVKLHRYSCFNSVV
ncbi:programmed cell death 1 ligand 1-like isoform X2 [Trachinotus anak]|uniref:programmed cell death 1 ligand 1-like isoform X2 n=1 Tax=Trachinotus anak TaxID=443729 RepID=UPI0039F20104